MYIHMYICIHMYTFMEVHVHRNMCTHATRADIERVYAYAEVPRACVLPQTIYTYIITTQNTTTMCVRGAEQLQKLLSVGP